MKIIDSYIAWVVKNLKDKKSQSMVIMVLVIIILVCSGYYLYQNYFKISPVLTKLIPITPLKLTGIGEIIVTKNGFSPEEILVKKGTAITWVNNDNLPHQITTDPYPLNNGLLGFDSGEPLRTNDTYTYTFEATGRFTYHDNLNPKGIKGVVRVE